MMLIVCFKISFQTYNKVLYESLTIHLIKIPSIIELDIQPRRREREVVTNKMPLLDKVLRASHLIAQTLTRLN